MPDKIRVLPGSIDTHCHLNHIVARDAEMEPLLRGLLDTGIAAIVDVGLLPEDLTERAARFGDLNRIVFSSGIHPSEIARSDIVAQLGLLATQIKAGSIVAVGEIGLDYHWDTGSRGDAVALFETQVQLAVEANLPVIVHNRDASDDVLSVLRELKPRGVMHCFSQDPEFCQSCLELDLFISFGGNITFKKSASIREAARIVPDTRLLVETDSPYLSPEPVRGRTNHPGHLGFTISALADLRSASEEEIVRQTSANAASLFGNKLQNPAK